MSPRCVQLTDGSGDDPCEGGSDPKLLIWIDLICYYRWRLSKPTSIRGIHIRVLIPLRCNWWWFPNVTSIFLLFTMQMENNFATSVRGIQIRVLIPLRSLDITDNGSRMWHLYFCFSLWNWQTISEQQLDWVKFGCQYISYERYQTTWELKNSV